MSSSEVPSAICFLKSSVRRLERLVGERVELLLQGIDGGDPRQIAANPPVIGGAEQLAGDGADHGESS